MTPDDVLQGNHQCAISCAQNTMDKTGFDAALQGLKVYSISSLQGVARLLPKDIVRGCLLFVVRQVHSH